MTLIVFLRVLVVGLASYRLARAIAVDSITDPIRLWLYDRAWPGGPIAAHEPGDRPWAWLFALASCPFCVGFWISLVLYACWVNVGWSRVLIAAVAVAGIQSLCSTADARMTR